MAATLIFLAKLLATALMPTTCNNMQQQFFATKNTFCNNFAFLVATFVAAKNDISCSESAFNAELWGVYNGLCLAKQNGLNNIELQIDSMTVVRTLSGDRLDYNGGRSLVRCIRRLFQEEWNIKIRHACVREAN
ncbi:Polynucleotidyl transferase, ribonuclease H superfamily protein [Trifolium repens]|nr:Polynucleotidyl transferase, ribonuclease H superfamily protein [Trifolium repens]